MNKLERIVRTAGAIGWENLPRRAAHAAARRTGLQRRRRPGGELHADQLAEHFVDGYGPEQAVERWEARARRFLFGPRRGPALRDALRWLVPDDVWTAEVEGVALAPDQGRMQLFDRFFADVGVPPEFMRDPVNDVRWPSLRHWSTYHQFDPEFADLRCVQEASRFAVAFAIARQVVRGDDEAAAERFWRLFDCWDRQNPYGLTPQWSSGHEATLRLFAWLFAAVATVGRPAATPERLARLTERAWYTGHHVEADLGAARSAPGLPALSGAAGLWTIGALFPELSRADAWRRRGRALLEAGLQRQILPDGSPSRHGVQFQRAVLDLVLWSARLGELTEAPMTEAALERVGAAFRWLGQMTDPESGRAPNYGDNDGTHVLPLSASAFGDMRPTLQAVSYLLYRRRCFPEGPWDEKMLWLFGPDALDADVGGWPRRGASWPIGGYDTFAGPQSWAMIRCHRYRDAPAQADMLHVDLWHQGRNVLRDAGTYLQYTEDRWQNYFSSTSAHNTLEIDGADQMLRGPRDLWLRWTKSRFLRRAASTDGRVDVFVGEHLGYTRLPGRPVHRRSLCRIDDAWIVVDDVLGQGEHGLTLRWHLFPTAWDRRDDGWVGRLGDNADWCVRLLSPEGARVVLLEGVDDPPEGWEALHYAERAPIPVLRTSVDAALPARFVTFVDAPRAPLRAVDGMTDPEGPLMLDGLGGAAESLAELDDPTFRVF